MQDVTSLSWRDDLWKRFSGVFFPPSGMLQKHFIATKPSRRNGLTEDGANRAGELSPLYHYSNDSNRPLAVAETVNVPTR